MNERRSTALPLPCSLSFALATRLRPRHSKSSKISTARSDGAEFVDARRRLVAQPCGNKFGKFTAQHRCRSEFDPRTIGTQRRREPQHVAAAASIRTDQAWQRLDHSDRHNALVALRRLAGRIGGTKTGAGGLAEGLRLDPIGGRGRGKGTSSATAIPPPHPASHKSANKSRMRWMSAGIEAFVRDRGATKTANRPYIITKPLRRPIR